MYGKWERDKNFHSAESIWEKKCNFYWTKGNEWFCLLLIWVDIFYGGQEVLSISRSIFYWRLFSFSSCLFFSLYISLFISICFFIFTILSLSLPLSLTHTNSHTLTPSFPTFAPSWYLSELWFTFYLSPGVNPIKLRFSLFSDFHC